MDEHWLTLEDSVLDAGCGRCGLTLTGPYEQVQAALLSHVCGAPRRSWWQRGWKR